MPENFAFSVEEEPSASDLQTIETGLVEYNDSQAELENWRRLTVFMRDANGIVVGGLNGCTHWHWLYVSQLWVAQAMRGRGYGREMMLRAEAEARERGCRYALLETIDFQALPFYQKLGYEIYSTLPDYPPGHVRYGLAKRDLSLHAAAI